jgi:hypothetical protein
VTEPIWLEPWPEHTADADSGADPAAGRILATNVSAAPDEFVGLD